MSCLRPTHLAMDGTLAFPRVRVIPRRILILWHENWGRRRLGIQVFKKASSFAERIVTAYRRVHIVLKTSFSTAFNHVLQTLWSRAKLDGSHIAESFPTSAFSWC
jgi:hypothetical protein